MATRRKTTITKFIIVGDMIHHHDQFITLSSFSEIKIICTTLLQPIKPFKLDSSDIFFLLFYWYYFSRPYFSALHLLQTFDRPLKCACGSAWRQSLQRLTFAASFLRMAYSCGLMPTI
jgi:hypothetical protein